MAIQVPRMEAAVSRVRSAVVEGRRRSGFTLERFASWAISNNDWFWRLARATPGVNSFFNRRFIDFIATRAPCRPQPFSLWGPVAGNPRDCADYVSWTSLVDRTYTGRHLPPASAADIDALKSLPEVAPLFDRGPAMSPCPKSTALFCFFAQWFTDSFLRTEPGDIRRNTSNHEIDLCQIYGLNACDTRLLRRLDGSGKLKSQRLATPGAGDEGGEFPPWLFTEDGSRIRKEFRGLSYVNKEGTGYLHPILFGEFDEPERRARLFAAGLERANSTIFYSAINTVFLREHNRLCDVLAAANPSWKGDDDRLFETARNINIAQLLKVIVEDYINHISPAKFPVFFELGWAETRPWYRTNRICAEFNLLYRWHSLVPTTVRLGGRQLAAKEFMFNNRVLVEEAGLAAALEAASAQSAGRITLENTAAFLLEAEKAALRKGREWRLQSFNTYRDYFNLARLGSFGELTDDEALAQRLQAVFRDVDRVDLAVGLLAEDGHAHDAVFGNLMAYMVGVDAFSQALTNPLLSGNVFGERAFGAQGVEIVKSTRSFAQIVERNLGRAGPCAVTFTLPMKPVPGDFRLPLLGKVQDIAGMVGMLLHWEGYFTRRRAKYRSTVFRVNLYQPTVAVLDHAAISALFESRDFVQDYGFSWARPPRKLVGATPSVFEAGAAHDRPKALYLRLLEKRRADFEATFASVSGEFIDRWVAMPKPFGLRDELERFAAAFLTQWLLGERFDADRIRLLYSNIFSHVFPALTDVFRGRIYARSCAIHREWVEFVKSAPEFERTIVPLAAAECLHDRQALAEQVAFLVGMNSFLGTQNVLKSLVAELWLHPDWRESIRAGVPSGGPMPRIDMFLLETLRLHPPVTFIFGRATRSRPVESSWGTFQVKPGELLMGVLPLAQTDAAEFDEPEAFRPDRFLSPEAALRLVWARGYHGDRPTERNRTCAGANEGLLIARAFALALLQRADWDFEAAPEWSRDRFALNVAAPVGEMRVNRFAAIGAR